MTIITGKLGEKDQQKLIYKEPIGRTEKFILRKDRSEISCQQNGRGHIDPPADKHENT